MLGAERLVYGLHRRNALHGAPRRDAGAIRRPATSCAITPRPSTCTGSTRRPRHASAPDRRMPTSGRIRAGSPIAAPASWRPRTRWRRFASAPRMAIAPSNATSSCRADGVPFLLHDDDAAAHDQRPRRRRRTQLERAVAARRRRLAQPRLRRRADASARSDRRAFACATHFALDLEIKPTPGQRRARPAGSSPSRRATLWRRRRAAAAELVHSRSALEAARARAPELPRAPAARHPAAGLARRSAGARLRRRSS